jgi:hypothetical protein
METATSDDAQARRLGFLAKLELGFTAAFAGAATSLVGLVVAGHGGPFLPAALFGGPWAGSACWLGRVAHLPDAWFFALYLGGGALGYVGYLYLLLGPLRRVGYRRGLALVAAFHSLGIIWSMVMAWRMG